jgi:hypothetical protein
MIKINHKTERVYRAIGQIDDGKITEAGSPVYVRRVPTWKLVAPLAAACLVVVAAAVFVLPLFAGDSGITPGSQGGTSATVTSYTTPSTPTDVNATHPLVINSAAGLIADTATDLSGLIYRQLEDEEIRAAFPHIASAFNQVGADAFYTPDGELFWVNLFVLDNADYLTQIHVLFNGKEQFRYGSPGATASNVHGIPVIAGSLVSEVDVNWTNTDFEVLFALDGISYRITAQRGDEVAEPGRSEWLTDITNTIIRSNVYGGLVADLSVIATIEAPTDDFLTLAEARNTDLGDFLPTAASVPSGVPFNNANRRIDGDIDSLTAVWENTSRKITWSIYSAPNPDLFIPIELTLEAVQVAADRAAVAGTISIDVVVDDVAISIYSQGGVTAAQLWAMLQSVDVLW